VRDLHVGGVIAETESGWRITADLTDRITVPHSVRGMVERKLVLSCDSTLLY